MTLGEWTEMQRQNLHRDIRRRKIDASRPLAHEKMVEWMTLYGFDGDDFRCVVTPVNVVATYDLSFEPPVCSLTERVAKTVLRWRLKAGVIPQEVA